MVQRRHLAAFIFCFAYFTSEAFANAWITPEGDYNLGIQTSSASSILPGTIMDVDKYNKLSHDLANIKNNIDHISSNSSQLPKEVAEQRIDNLRKLYQNLELQRQNLNTKTNKYSSCFYLERGIGTSKSFGLRSNYTRTQNHVNSNENEMNLEVFYKKKWYQKRNWTITPEFGLSLEDQRKATFMPFFKINMAYVTKIKSDKKLISQMSFTNYFDNVTYVNFSVSQTLEFANKISLQLLEFQSFNKNNFPAFRYYYKNQFSIAKQFPSCSIAFFEGSTISTGIYREYFGERRKASARGVFAGIWLKF